MENFNDYKFADISTKENSEITQLENQINSDTGKKVVLIAYENKDSAC